MRAFILTSEFYPYDAGGVSPVVANQAQYLKSYDWDTEVFIPVHIPRSEKAKEKFEFSRDNFNLQKIVSLDVPLGGKKYKTTLYRGRYPLQSRPKFNLNFIVADYHKIQEEQAGPASELGQDDAAPYRYSHEKAVLMGYALIELIKGKHVPIPDIMHFHHPFLAVPHIIVDRFLIERYPGLYVHIPSVLTIHGHLYEGPQLQKMYLRGTKKFIRSYGVKELLVSEGINPDTITSFFTIGAQLADAIVMPSQEYLNKKDWFVKEILELTKSGPHKEKTFHAVNNGLNLKIYNPSYRPKDAEEKKKVKAQLAKKYLNKDIGDSLLVSFPNRVESAKGITIFLKAIPKLLEWNKNMVFVVRGGLTNKKLSELLKETIEKYPDNAFYIREQMLPEEMRILYAASDIVVSMSMHESFGLTPLEAISMGAATVVSDIPAFRLTGGADKGFGKLAKITTTQNWGKIERYDEHNIPIYIDALKEVASNIQEYHKKIVKNGDDWCSQFSWAQSAKTLSGLYHRLLEG